MVWYEEEVRGLERKRLQINYDPKLIFYGSSTIRLWKDLHVDFHEFKPINLGFGGSTLEACGVFFERIVAPFQPESIILYAGDNDLGDGKQPEEVLAYFQQLSRKIRTYYPNIPYTFISIKPSLSRINILDRIRKTNELILEEIQKKGNGYYYINTFDEMIDEHGVPQKELFEPDGLHLSQKGYELWKQIIYSNGFVHKNPHTF